jgi:glyoxylase-like metal-dependent hydrolase (beta-lactamase superfamily II)
MCALCSDTRDTVDYVSTLTGETEYGRSMKKLLFAVVATLAAVTGFGQNANPVAAAAAALGADGLKSIRYSGWGSDYIFGQAHDGASAWPRFSVPGMSVAIDYTTNKYRDERRRAQAENPPLGGGFQPLSGELRQIWALSGGYAWDITGQTVAPAAVERDTRSAVLGRTTQIWLTPQGFIKAAQAGAATVRVETVRGARKTIVSVTTPLMVRLEGVLNEQNLVERIETWIANPVLGDIKIEAVFSDYKDFGGVAFPMHIVQRSAGYPVLDLKVTDVTTNVAVALEVPPAIKQAAQPAALIPEKISDGLWIVPGGAKSVVIEFRDHVVIVEAPETEARSLAVIDAVHKTIPGKQIRYVINTHTHFDHAGGLRTYAADGATIVTQAGNIPYYQQIWSNPRTIEPDRLAKSGRVPAFEGIIGSRTFRDETREMVVYPYQGNMHNPGMLMLFLPKERLLIEADSWTPPGNPNEPPAGLINLVQFLGVVDRLSLDVQQVLPIHGRLTTLDEARAAAATFGQTQVFR